MHIRLQHSTELLQGPLPLVMQLQTGIVANGTSPARTGAPILPPVDATQTSG